MKFKEFNFKLLVINELLLLKLVTPEMATILKKNKEGYYREYFEDIMNSSDDPESEDYTDEDEYGCHPEMEEELAAIDIPANYLEKIRKLTFDYGQTQGMLAPHWHGEDEMFKVTSIQEIVCLKNLEKIEFSFILPDEDIEKMDLRPLLKLTNLRKISFSKTYSGKTWLEAHKAVFINLESKGVAIPEK